MRFRFRIAFSRRTSFKRQSMVAISPLVRAGFRATTFRTARTHTKMKIDNKLSSMTSKMQTYSLQNAKQISWELSELETTKHDITIHCVPMRKMAGTGLQWHLWNLLQTYRSLLKWIEASNWNRAAKEMDPDVSIETYQNRLDKNLLLHRVLTLGHCEIGKIWKKKTTFQGPHGASTLSQPTPPVTSMFGGCRHSMQRTFSTPMMSSGL